MEVDGPRDHSAGLPGRHRIQEGLHDLVAVSHLIDDKGVDAVSDPTDYSNHLLQILEWIAFRTLKSVSTATYPLARTANALNDPI